MGTAYPSWLRNNIANSSGTVAQRASAFRVSRSTVYRIDSGLCQPNAREPGPKLLLSPEMAASLAVMTLGYPQISLFECQCYMQQAHGIRVSLSTISREFKRLGFSRKIIKRESNKRDEEQRVQWWTSPPPRGCFGLFAPDLVDIDESHFILEKSWRQYGRSLVGMPAVVRSHVSGIDSVA